MLKQKVSLREISKLFGLDYRNIKNIIKTI